MCLSHKGKIFLSLSRHNEKIWANGLKKHLFARILEEKKQTNKQINIFFMSKGVQIIVI